MLRHSSGGRMDKIALSTTVQAYRHKSLKQWILISAIALVFVISICGFLTFLQGRMYNQHSNEYLCLKDTISSLHQQWGASQKLAQKIKLLKKECALIADLDLGKYLTNIAHAIPELTYITTLDVDADVCKLQGFAQNKEEVTEFIRTLHDTFKKNITHEYCNEAGGLHFSISIEL